MAFLRPLAFLLLYFGCADVLMSYAASGMLAELGASFLVLAVVLIAVVVISKGRGKPDQGRPGFQGWVASPERQYLSWLALSLTFFLAKLLVLGLFSLVFP